MVDQQQNLLIRNGFIDISTDTSAEAALYAPIDLAVATVISNLATYGYTVDRRGYEALLTAVDLPQWWQAVEPVLADITGSNRNMSDHMVFKNFPREVLEMSHAESVIKQILIYLGAPYDALREEERARPPLGDITRLKVLTLAGVDTRGRIYADLLAMRNRWSDNQTEWAGLLAQSHNAIECSNFAFKENAIVLAAANFETMEFVPSSATDVLRLAAALSGGDISLRERVKFRAFKREERRRLLRALETQDGIAEDMVTRPGPWKRLMHALRPGDSSSQYPKVVTAFDQLYKGTIKPFSALIDPQQPTSAVLDAAVTRPGEFLRRFHHFYNLFGGEVVTRFMPVMEKLSTRQLASLRGYLRTINSRTSLIYPPRSNWSRAQVLLNEKRPIDNESIKLLDYRISQLLKVRLAEAFPEGVALDMRVDQVRLQTNDQKLAEYGRGTEFDIPANITFLRSASYWENAGQFGVTWFDNGWNFFDADWRTAGVCCWNSQMLGDAAVFSGDPVNLNDLKGRACQMIDLYLDKLADQGVRYAVWNVLCYSRRKFSQATGEVLATLQMGENPETGKHYEPARAQMVFPLRSNSLASYVAYVDIVRRKLVYMDAALPGRVQSAEENYEILQTLMPAYIEYLAAQPTILDVLQDAPQGVMPVLYDDASTDITHRRAYVFRPENKRNTYDRVSLTDLIGG